MRYKIARVFLFVLLLVIVTGCGSVGTADSASVKETEEAAVTVDLAKKYNATTINLSDSGITVDGAAIGADESAAVYAANDIVFYLEGQDFTYGEGTKEDEHSQAEADAHTVVHITKPGNYVLRGSLSKGQVAVDLGEDAEDNPEAVVTLILDNVDITCEVAPAVIFYNVYECGSDDEEDASNAVDTTAAGANVIIADGTENNVTGSYVARIYESVELSEDGTEVVDSKKLHKYDAAFYSKMSMNMNGEEANSGVLNIKADNEGLDSELHLTMNGGNINITSGNDGINTNEDGISVTTINGGNLNIVVDGSTGEGDGIDSNGWLVINGGTVNASACAFSADAGIDSDMGIHINGGNVIATGNMLDEIADSKQNYAVFSFASSQKGGSTISLKNEEGVVIGEWTQTNDFTMLIFSGEELKAGTYTLWNGEEKLSVQGAGNGMIGRGPMVGGKRPELPMGGERPEMPMDGERPELPEGERNFERPEGEPPEGEMPEIPEGEGPTDGAPPELPNSENQNQEVTMEFTISDGGNLFMEM